MPNRYTLTKGSPAEGAGLENPMERFTVPNHSSTTVEDSQRPQGFDCAQLADFLAAVCTPGRVQLASIPPDGGGGPSAHNFDAADRDAIAGWADRLRGKHNLYFALNEPRADAANRKLRKTDVGRLRGVYVDLDPRSGLPLTDEKQRLIKVARENLDGNAPATLVIDSGNGVQLLWLFKKPLLATSSNKEKAERLGRDLAALLGGDSVQNVDRLLRLPFTTNLPTSKKRQAGRVAVGTRLLHSDGARWDVDELRALIPNAPQTEQKNQACQAVHFDWPHVVGVAEYADVPATVRDKFERALREDVELRALWDNGIKKGADESRSGYDAALACALKQHQFGATEVGQILQVFEFGRGPSGELDERYLTRLYGRAPVKTAVEDFCPIDGNTFEDAAGWDREAIKANADKLPYLKKNAPAQYEMLRATWNMRGACTYEQFDRIANVESSVKRSGAQGLLGLDDLDGSNLCLTAGEYVPDREWLIENLIPSGEVGSIVAPPGVGKTMFMLAVAEAVVSGGRVAGSEWRALEPRDVLYLGAEEDEAEARRRLNQMIDRETAQTEWDGTDGRAAIVDRIRKGGRLVYKCVRDKHAALVTPGRQNTPAVQEIIDAANRLGNTGLIILDPAISFAGGDENSNNDVHALIVACRQIAKETGAAVAIVHHTSKAGASNGSRELDAGRGGGALGGGVRWHIGAATMTEIEAKRFSVDDRRQWLGLEVPKMSYGPTTGVKWFSRKCSAALWREEPPEKASKNDAAEYEQAVQRIVDRLRGEGKMTARNFSDRYAGRDGPLGLGEKKVRACLDRAVREGHIVVERISGRDYLSAPPPKDEPFETPSPLKGPDTGCKPGATASVSPPPPPPTGAAAKVWAILDSWDTGDGVTPGELHTACKNRVSDKGGSADRSAYHAGLNTLLANENAIRRDDGRIYANRGWQ